MAFCEAFTALCRTLASTYTHLYSLLSHLLCLLDIKREKFRAGRAVCYTYCSVCCTHLCKLWHWLLCLCIQFKWTFNFTVARTLSRSQICFSLTSAQPKALCSAKIAWCVNHQIHREVVLIWASQLCFTWLYHRKERFFCIHRLQPEGRGFVLFLSLKAPSLSCQSKWFSKPITMYINIEISIKLYKTIKTGLRGANNSLI